jgi:hypothetical protein
MVSGGGVRMKTYELPSDELMRSGYVTGIAYTVKNNKTGRENTVLKTLVDPDTPVIAIPDWQAGEEADISTYCRSIGKQIDYIHRCCPGAKILFVGTSDMSTRHKGNLQTYPMLPALIDSLAATAVGHNAAYWSIYHAMGGWNSMVNWNKKGLAGSDYIHFSQQGADKMGAKLAQALADNYQLFLLRRRLNQHTEE